MITSNGYPLDESPRPMGSLGPVSDHERLDRDALWNRLRRDGYLMRSSLFGDIVPGLV